MKFNNKAGLRADLGIHVRSNMEANVARFFNRLQKIGAIEYWQYEPETFWFLAIKRGVRSYKPDFKVKYKGEEKPVYIEVKGHMDAKSATKIKRFRKYYPQHRLEVIGTREYDGIRRKWKSAIPTWE
jgi:hypothetical protein